MEKAIEKVLKTWYPLPHKLHFDPLHPAMGLAGEAGELLNLIKKDKFKPNFSWWDCKQCGKTEGYHQAFVRHKEGNCKARFYMPHILLELGDYDYYWRILCYQDDMEAWDISVMYQPETVDLLEGIITLCTDSLYLLEDVQNFGYINNDILIGCFRTFSNIIYTLELNLPHIREVNHYKLNSEPTNHGWAGA